MSASFSSSAVSSSLTNRPLPPIFDSGESSSLSPRLTMGTSVTSRPGWACFQTGFDVFGLPQGERTLLRVAMRISREDMDQSVLNRYGG